MSNRGRCWLCGVLLDSGRGVCDECSSRIVGLCGRCEQRDTCDGLYRRAIAQCARDGHQTPSYPPCLMLPAYPQHRPQLERVQRRAYGLPVVGVVVLILAAETEASEREERCQMIGDVETLARAWGARHRRAA